MNKIMHKLKCFIILLIIFLYLGQYNTVKAISIDDSSVFLKQAPESVTCTLVSNAMLLRRKAILLGYNDWYSITENSLAGAAWINNVGMKNSYTFKGISVNAGYFSGNKTEELKKMLNEHPEGIVIYRTGRNPHAILITDYTNGIFYAADPSPYYQKGRIPISSASINIESASKYWYVSYPNTPVVTKPDASSTVPTTLITQESGIVDFSWPYVDNAESYNVTVKNTEGALVHQQRVYTNSYSIKLPNKGTYYMHFSPEKSGVDYEPARDSKQTEFIWYGENQNLGEVFYARIKNKTYDTYVYHDITNNNAILKNLDVSNSENGKYIFKFVRQSDGSYQINSTLYENLMFDASNNGSMNGTNIQFTINTGVIEAQNWFIDKHENGSYLFRKRNSFVVWDSGGTENNLKLWTFASTNIPNQQFEIERINNINYGFLKIGNDYYYYSDAGMLKNSWKQINDTYYYFGNNGKALKGWHAIGSKKYYFTLECKMVTGWNKIDDNWYYFNNNGHNITGWLNVNGSKYYLNNSGIMSIGFVEINGNTYYFNESGKMQTGWHNISNKTYYFDNDGKMTTGIKNISGKDYFFDSNGVMKTGLISFDSNKYYFSNGNILKNSWKYIDSAYYYFDKNGKAVKGFNKIGSQTYYFDNNHIMQTGWVLINQTWYYFNNSGHMYTGWQKINSYKYYFDQEGEMQTGWIKINNNKYYLGSNGKMVIGMKTIDSKIYYF